MTIGRKVTSRAAVFFYALIMMEGILMATPFGLLLYSFYDPFLEVMRRSVVTAWVAAFFLPQSVFETRSALVDSIRWYGQYLFYIGLVGFLVLAAQLYWAKIRRRGVVTSFVYSYVRHPQYLFFMLAGAGLIFIWPRMMMLILFTMMSIFYFYLAKFEERRMLAQHPSYADYMKKTAMFIPGNPGGRIFALTLGRIPNRQLAHGIAIALVVAAVFGAAIGLRNLTIASLSIAELSEQNILAISIFPHDTQYLRSTVDKAMAHDSIRNAIAARGNVSFTAHVLPANYGMLGKFSEIDRETREKLAERFRHRSSLTEWLWGTESNEVKVVFSRIDKPGRGFVPLAEIMDMSAKMTPVLVADLDLATGELIEFTLTSTTYYGDVPQPIF